MSNIDLQQDNLLKKDQFSFFCFIFWKKNPWTLFIAHNKGRELKIKGIIKIRSNALKQVKLGNKSEIAHIKNCY